MKLSYSLRNKGETVSTILKELPCKCGNKDITMFSFGTVENKLSITCLICGMETTRVIVLNSTIKTRLYPMKMSNEDTENWLDHPEIVKQRIHEQIKINHPSWNIKSITLDPNLNRLSYRGKPMLPTKDELMFAVVEVPKSESDELFTDERE